MSNRGFSGTTVAIVVLLLVALFGIGHIPGVNPPPAQPEKPAPAPSVNQPLKNGRDASLSKMMEMKKRMQAEMKAKKAANPKASTLKPVKDPSTIDATGDFFKQKPDGPQGIKLTQEEIAKQKAEYDRYRKEVQKYIHPSSPSSSAGATPSAAR